MFFNEELYHTVNRVYKSEISSVGPQPSTDLFFEKLPNPHRIRHLNEKSKTLFFKTSVEQTRKRILTNFCVYPEDITIYILAGSLFIADSFHP